MASPLRILVFASANALTASCIVSQDLGSTAEENDTVSDSAVSSEVVVTTQADVAMGDGRGSADARPEADADAAFDCDKILEVDQIQPATCAFVDPVSHRVAHLRWACSGGPARLVIDTLELDGTVKNGTVQLSGCREDPSSTLSGHYETVEITADLGAMKGSLVYARASGLACPKVYTDCSATAGLTILP